MSENNEFTITNATLKAIFQDAEKLCGEDTPTKLPEIIHAKGFSMEKSVEIANRVLAGVDNFDQVLSETTEGGKAVAGRMSQLQPQDQLTLARNIRVIHAAMNDEKIQEALQNGASLQELRDQMFGPADDMTDEDIAAFVSETLDKMEEMGLTEHAAKRMLAAIKRNRKVLKTMRSISNKDYDLKVCAALEIYLSTDETVTVEDAVTIACTSVELHRVADDLDRGIITSKAAYVLIMAIGLAAVLNFIEIIYKFGMVAIMVPELGLSMFIISLLALMGIIAFSDTLSEKLPLWVGWMSVRAADIGRQAVETGEKVVSDVSSMAAEAGQKVASFINRRKNSDEAEDGAVDEDDLDIHVDEEMDEAALDLN